ncbi:CsbD family protein [Sphingomonas sp. GlSt437]|uniref:CsbD family protein n=1 Tax=Sphingomonas sp. GlSt437 TaxID=3389970 RepID=UPI003A85C67D
MGELTDKIKGTVNDVIGKAKQESRDPETRAEGLGQELKGKAQKAVGDIKGAINRL